jgi:hypothetical protein
MAQQAPSPHNRRVGLRLGAAIFFMPWAFAWFTLRKGYSDRAKQVAFGLAIVLLLFAAWPKVTARWNGGSATPAPA